jgi:hypothetical protein
MRVRLMQSPYVFCSRNYAVEVLDGAVNPSGHVTDYVRQP